MNSLILQLGGRDKRTFPLQRNITIANSFPALDYSHPTNKADHLDKLKDHCNPPPFTY